MSDFVRAFAVSDGRVLVEGGGAGLIIPMGFRLDVEAARALVVELARAIDIAQSFVPAPEPEASP